MYVIYDRPISFEWSCSILINSQVTSLAFQKWNWMEITLSPTNQQIKFILISWNPCSHMRGQGWPASDLRSAFTWLVCEFARLATLHQKRSRLTQWTAILIWRLEAWDQVFAGWCSSKTWGTTLPCHFPASGGWSAAVGCSRLAAVYPQCQSQSLLGLLGRTSHIGSGPTAVWPPLNLTNHLYNDPVSK